IDATNLTPRERRPYLKIGELFDCTTEALYFDVPLEICKERNRLRARVVPDDVMDQMAIRLVPPGLEEGFSTVTRIGVGD
ncbi:MAG: AAA family ATPase, partial [Bryobacteraceae bacterium]